MEKIRLQCKIRDPCKEGMSSCVSMDSQNALPYVCIALILSSMAEVGKIRTFKFAGSPRVWDPWGCLSLFHDKGVESGQPRTDPVHLSVRGWAWAPLVTPMGCVCRSSKDSSKLLSWQKEGGKGVWGSLWPGGWKPQTFLLCHLPGSFFQPEGSQCEGTPIFHFVAYNTASIWKWWGIRLLSFSHFRDDLRKKTLFPALQVFSPCLLCFSKVSFCRNTLLLTCRNHIWVLIQMCTYIYDHSFCLWNQF